MYDIKNNHVNKQTLHDVGNSYGMARIRAGV